MDVTTIGASIAYGYVSFCTFMVARKEGRRWVMASGCAGVAISTAFIVYFLVPNFWVVDALATESYFILSAWCILGVIVFRRIFKHDESGRLGATTVAWLVLLFLIFFSSHMWNRQKTRDLTDRVVAEIKQRYMPIDKDGNVTKEEEDAASFLMVQKEWVNDTLTHYNMVQIALVLIALAMIHSISSIISRREKEASKARSYFFSTISHDIRTPLNAIVGFSQMLKLGIKSNEEKEEAVNSILVSSKSLLSLVNDILDLSRRGSDKSDVTPVHTDCHALLHEIVQSFRVGSVKEGLEIRDKIGEMPQLLLDALRLRHTAFNIISNAVKFTERGFVEIRARFDRDPPDDPDDDQEEETGTLLVEVEDTGVGISDEDKHRIDMPYVQTASKISRHGGTGLGLAVCRQFTEAMGGTLTFDSELGKGSTFRITIPKVKVAHEAVVVEGIESETEEEVVSPHTPNIPLAHSPAPVPPAQPRLLLVDDQKMNLAVLRALVKRVGGFEIETAADGKEAFARLQNADAPKIDAVLTDMWMPDMDGAGLAKAIRADTKLAHLPVHVITADVELQETYAEKGFDSIILKPVTVATLSPLLVGIAEHKASAA